MYPYLFEIPWYIGDSFVFMNVAHGLDRVDNDARAVKGNHWIMSNKSSAGSTESIVRIFVEVR